MAEGNKNRTSSGSDPELAELAAALRDLTRRVERLESRIGGPVPVPRVAPVSAPAKPTLESRLGSQYLNRAGIIALLVGVSFAVHWAFANHWIGATAILTIGFLGGVAVIALGRWFMRRQYAAFGLSLQALGVGALYIVLWAGFQIYQVIPSPAALAGMVVLTAATATAAVVQDSEALAVFAYLGGFATPFLLATGQNRQVELFVYLLVLSTGMAVTLGFRRWSRLLLVSFFACVTVVTAWFFSYYTDAQWVSTLVFTSILFAIFLTASLLLEAGSKATLVIVPAATAAYVCAVYATAGSPQTALIEVLLAAALLVIAWMAKRSDRLRALFFTVAMACLVLAVPTEFDTRWTTSFLWLALGLALMIAGFKTGVSFVRWVALVLIGLTVLKVFVFDLSRLETGYRIIAMAVVGVALLGISFLYQRNWLRLPRQ